MYFDIPTVKAKLSEVHAEEIIISTIREYDNYYVDREYKLPLPVYKAEVVDKNHVTYYLKTENGNIRYFNTNTKVRRWAYQILHSFELGFLVKHPVLWNIIMWATMIGGTLVSITGVWLRVKCIIRKVKRIFRNFK